MATFNFNSLQQRQQNHHVFSSITPCKYSSTLSFKSHYFISHVFTISTLRHTLHQELSSVLIPKASFSNNLDAKISHKEHKYATKTIDSTIEKMGSGFSPLKSKVKRVERKPEFSSVMEEKVERKYRKVSSTRKYIEFRRKGEMGSGVSSLRLSGDEKVEIKANKTTVNSVVDEKVTKFSKRSRSNSEIRRENLDRKSNKSKGENEIGKEKKNDNSKKKKLDLVEVQFRIELDMCSKRGDFLSAITLYDSVQSEGNVKLGQYHYTVLLYLCSSAAVGVVSPAKSGNDGQSFNKVLISEVSSMNFRNSSKNGDLGTWNFNSRIDLPVSSNGLFLESTKSHNLSCDKMETYSNGSFRELAKHGDEGRVDHKELKEILNHKSEHVNPKFSNGIIALQNREADKEDCEIRVTGDVKKFALMKGFEIYEKMGQEKIPLNEAALTSVARMAMSMGDGKMAFEMVKKTKELGIKPRLRSYGPALFTFCNNGEIDKAFEVEEHMLKNGVYPEEPELQALLKVSVENGNADKVYYLLHQLRKSVRQVSVSTANLIEKWFGTKAASRVGKRKWDQRSIVKGIENGGGGWHGQGWLGNGKWTVVRTFVGTDGICEGCWEKLVTVDLDPVETENFAKSVAAIAVKREKNSSFQKFQKWLDYYGPFEAVVDAANVGLFSQRNFSLSKVNAIVNGIRQKLPSKKWPLIVVHNKRITGGRMEEPANKTLIEKWKNADALFPTPTGSNDDWYWLYAAIRFKCLIVTNDEMRDHIFQLLGNDFFPRWKERHQVHFSFRDGGPEFDMPPPCSVVVQESEKGHWHIPIASERDLERDRTWLCVTRIHIAKQYSLTRRKARHLNDSESESQKRRKMKLPVSDHHNGAKIHQNIRSSPQETYRNLRNILSATVFSNCRMTPISDIEEAEKLGGCPIDFQI